jgi:hypothetical protein
MKKSTAKNILAGGLLAAGVAVVGAVTAHADDPYYPFSGPKGDHDASAYWVDISPMLTGTVQDAGNLAQTICGDLNQGISAGDVIAAAAHGDQYGVSEDTFVVDAAEWHFCPEYY